MNIRFDTCGILILILLYYCCFLLFCRFPAFSKMAPLGRTSTLWWLACYYWNRTLWVVSNYNLPKNCCFALSTRDWLPCPITLALYLYFSPFISSWAWPSITMLTSPSTVSVSGSQVWWGKVVNGMTMLFSSPDWTSAPGRMSPATPWVRLCSANLNKLNLQFFSQVGGSSW